jgi:alkanesulfonate monooxygenase SsuD/methylene tetrahydromethanopterin reductase-like flavin-dependent oxidoreductase (luciferase family)
MLAEWEQIWAGDEIGPKPPNGRPTLIIGGSADIAFERAARYGDGWIMGGGSPDQFAGGAEKLDAAWAKAGRDGKPRTMALAYFALGDHPEEDARSYLGDYYSFLGDYADQIVASAATDAETVQQYVKAFSDAGCDELILFPSNPDPHQVDLLADALP